MNLMLEIVCNDLVFICLRNPIVIWRSYDGDGVTWRSSNKHSLHVEEMTVYLLDGVVWPYLLFKNSYY